MVLNRLLTLSIEELKTLVRREGVKNADHYDREALIEILEEIQEDKADERRLNNDIMRVKGRKYDITGEDFINNPDNDEYIIPEQYPDTFIHLLMRDPYWVYAYWEMNFLETQKLKEQLTSYDLILRVYELLENTDSIQDAISSFEIPVQDSDSSWYINLPNPGSWYLVDLLIETQGNQPCVICRSQTVKSPGGYWLNHTDELVQNKKAYELFIAGISDTSGHTSDNTLVQSILDNITTAKKAERGE